MHTAVYFTFAKMLCQILDLLQSADGCTEKSSSLFDCLLMAVLLAQLLLSKKMER